MVTSKIQRGHSSIVEMALVVDGTPHRIGQLGPNFLILETAFVHAPTEAEIVTNIDGREDRWSVYLPAGISTSERRVTIKPIASR
jgi:hypothetical protein